MRPTPVGAVSTMRCTAPTRYPKRTARPGGQLNPVRGNKVFQWSKRFLDEIAPLASGSHRKCAAMPCRRAVGSELREHGGDLARKLRAADRAWRLGQAGRPRQSFAVRRLSRQPVRAPRHPAETQRPARRNPDRQPALHRQGRHRRVADVLLEAAITTIVDLEDSIAAVDRPTRFPPTATGWDL